MPEWAMWILIGAAVLAVVCGQTILVWRAAKSGSASARTNLDEQTRQAIVKAIEQSLSGDAAAQGVKKLAETTTNIRDIADLTAEQVNRILTDRETQDRETKTHSYWTGMVGVAVGALAGYALGESVSNPWLLDLFDRHLWQGESWPGWDWEPAVSVLATIVVACVMTALITLGMHRYTAFYWEHDPDTSQENRHRAKLVAKSLLKMMRVMKFKVPEKQAVLCSSSTSNGCAWVRGQQREGVKIEVDGKLLAAPDAPRGR